MAEQELAELVDLADAVEARLTKAEALLMVLRSTSTSTINDNVLHDYIRTVQDLIEEARTHQNRLWREAMNRLQTPPRPRTRK
ncbi:hypothetical protein [Thiohalomonas denitrificans]|uniref:hypothetical protein n=1 Tax=Thiohalomonas denitrificans TaxID=415747 RepID=UPI0026ECFEE7|nr:hypothetical protein [Thiohalomonas denitrificans]